MSKKVTTVEGNADAEQFLEDLQGIINEAKGNDWEFWMIIEDVERLIKESYC